MGSFGELDIIIKSYCERYKKNRASMRKSIEDDINDHLNNGKLYNDLCTEAKEVLDEYFEYKEKLQKGGH